MNLDYRIVERAEEYPYDLREEAFVFRDGEVHPYDVDELANRTPVVAIGSNASPRRLASKFGAGAVVPVRPAELRHRSVVYAAAITSYGAVPATLTEVPGALALVAVTYLDDTQLERMHASESLDRNYELVDVGRLVVIDGKSVAGSVLAYRSLYGPLRIDGKPVRLAEVPTVGTQLSAAYQSSMLALLHRHFAAHGEIYAAFIGDLVGSPERRAGIMAELKVGLSTKPVRDAN